MDRAVFLNSSGGIVDFYGNGNYIPSLKIAPYVETVAIPVVSVNSSALYGDHPENLATVTYSSGAALTFFCDSVAGGNDSSGDGSFDNPWRSLNTASKFLSCAACTLNAAAEYIQLKIKGTVDYVSDFWRPLGYVYNGGVARKFILTGWGERCDLSDNREFMAGYKFNLKVNLESTDTGVCSGCTVVGSCIDRLIDCELDSAYTSIAYNCSGAPTEAEVWYSGGVLSRRATIRYSYKLVASLAAPGECINVRSAAVSANVVARQGGSSMISAVSAAASALFRGCTIAASGARVYAIPNGGDVRFLDCNVTAAALVSGGDEVLSGSYRRASAYADVGYTAGAVVSGGEWRATASCFVSASGAAEVYATASGFHSRATVYGVSTTLTASAGATLTTSDPGNHTWEAEEIYNLGESCIVFRDSHVGSAPYVSSSGSLCQ